MRPCVTNDLIFDGNPPSNQPCETVNPCAHLANKDYTTLANVKLEFKLDGLKLEEEQRLAMLITQCSELLDTDCNVASGYFAPAAKDATLKSFKGNGTIFIQTPMFVPGSIELVSINGTEISPDIISETPNGISLSTFQGVHLGCCNHQHGCLDVEVYEPSRLVFPWDARVCVKARWGMAKIDKAVERAVLDMVLQEFRRSDPALAALQTVDGQQVTYERRPLSWYIVTQRYKGEHAKRQILSAFGL